MSNTKKFIVYPVLTEEEDKGHVWLTETNLVSAKKRRKVAKLIANNAKGKPVFCEIHRADRSYQLRWLMRLQANEDAEKQHEDIKTLKEFSSPAKVSLSGLKKDLEDDVIFISKSYRTRLGVGVGDLIEIKLKYSWCNIVRQGWGHPETIVRFSTFIAIIGVLGLLVAIAALPPVWLWLESMVS
ncbi:MAG: hypothetical protein H8E25_14995 [Planctomycetes bacterium]|nr:hypothetical protein [Planctomycetota bacterium]